MSGAMGGSKSEEFLAHTENGEDTFVRCLGCGYAANVEAVTVSPATEVDFSNTPAAHIEETPKTPTIDSLVELSNSRPDLQRSDRQWNAADTLKNVVFKLQHPDGSTSLLAVGLPGDREVDLKRLESAIHPAEASPLEEADFAANPILKKGYIGPQILGSDSESKIPYLVDPRVVSGTRWISGANQYNHHVYDLTCGRDFVADGFIQAAEVRAGDDCPTGCGGELTAARGIEIGHIFQLGRKYAEALDLQVLNEQGERVTVTMGSYGIGVSRAVAAIAEQHHDDKGLIWPREVSPADVHLVATGKDDAVFTAAEELAAELEAAGVRVLYDDRKVSPGVKFNDAELLGIPTIVVVGKLLADGKIEVKDRASGEKSEVDLAVAGQFLKDLIAN